ncbi:MAG: hypothetical protein M9916_10680 [Crocinitomicaceae bacterium]|nr:hypothetical protein [Crocinitomicaceae bacterium]
MKILIQIIVSLLLFESHSQTIYDFSNNPFSSGWNYYDDYNSSPNAGFTYDAINERINYSLNTSVEVSFLHTQLSNPLSKNYCIVFEITPTNANNYNTFFPLILTPNQVTGSDIHPWRKNKINSNTAGPVQSVDFIAIEIFSNELRFFNHTASNTTNVSIQSMSPAFHLTANTSYWVKLEVMNQTTAIITIYSDYSLNNVLAFSQFTIPVLEDMNHLYIANSNGNSYCTQYGHLDNYYINMCGRLDIEKLQFERTKKRVKIINFMGQEVHEQSNTPLIYIFDDGSTQKVFIQD